VAVELLVIGTGGQAKETAQLARQIDPGHERWDRISYVSGAAEQRGQRLPYGEVRYTDAEVLALQRAVDVAIGIGDPASRCRIARMLGSHSQLHFPNLIHPRVEIDDSVVSLGRGNLVCKGVVMTCDIAVGDFNLINWNVTIGHDCRIGSCCVVNPAANVSGHVEIGDRCLIGTGAQILQKVSLPALTVIGAGAVLRSSPPYAGTYVGVPARRVG
jgi:sugar O-acyltransferase (sialic acid O-acetyltransferase NeuD family)